MRISSDQSLLAFTIDTRGDEVYTLHFKDLSNGRILEGQSVTGVVSVVFAEPLVPRTRDGHSTRVVFYTKPDRCRGGFTRMICLASSAIHWRRLLREVAVG